MEGGGCSTPSPTPGPPPPLAGFVTIYAKTTVHCSPDSSMCGTLTVAGKWQEVAAHAWGPHSPPACWALPWWRHACRHFGYSSGRAGREKRWEPGPRSQSPSAPRTEDRLMRIKHVLPRAYTPWKTWVLKNGRMNFFPKAVKKIFWQRGTPHALRVTVFMLLLEPKQWSQETN